jgi:antitoxin YefM
VEQASCLFLRKAIIVYLDEWKIMIPIYEAQKQLQQSIDSVSESHQLIAIAGQTSNTVLLSEADWASVARETLYLLSVPGMRESIREGIATPIEVCDRELQW